MATATMDRDEAIKRIKAALKRRSGKAWSVTGGKGTAWGWIEIDATPKNRTWHFKDTGRRDDDGQPIYEEINDPSQPFGHMSPADREELAGLLDLTTVHYQGQSIAASSDHRREYVDRAEGRTPTVIGQTYWD
jgi:hypothetical protein